MLVGFGLVMAKRLFIHVGTPKTGTTFLQSVLWSNKDVLAEQGLLLPLDKVRDHFYLSNIARDAPRAIATMPRRAKSVWPRALEQLAGWDGDALISHELFAPCSAERAQWTIDQLRDVADEVHTILTGRDLARQVPAEWQQSIKHGRTHPLRTFYALVQEHDPSVLFWAAQDLALLMDHWSQGIPPDHAHLITVPAAGGPRHLLWDRYATLIGVDPASVDQSVNRPNESLGLEEIETLRRVNVHAPMGVHKPLKQLMVRQVLAEDILANRPDAKRFAPPPEVHPWVVERGTAMVQQLRDKPYDVVGDLDELLPPADPVLGPLPDDVDDSVVAAVAVATVSAVLYRTHDLETAKVRARLRAELDAKTQRINALERQLARSEGLERQVTAAWEAYEREYALPVWKHAARRVRNIVRGVVRPRR